MKAKLGENKSIEWVMGNGYKYEELFIYITHHGSRITVLIP